MQLIFNSNNSPCRVMKTLIFCQLSCPGSTWFSSLKTSTIKTETWWDLVRFLVASYFKTFLADACQTYHGHSHERRTNHSGAQRGRVEFGIFEKIHQLLSYEVRAQIEQRRGWKIKKEICHDAVRQIINLKLKIFMLMFLIGQVQVSMKRK